MMKMENEINVTVPLEVVVQGHDILYFNLWMHKTYTFLRFDINIHFDILLLLQMHLSLLPCYLWILRHKTLRSQK